MKKVAQWQPYVFGLGVAGISMFMMGAGTLGVARRHWDMTFAGTALPYDYPGAAFLMMGLNGLSAMLAAIGGIMYVVVVVGSVLFGRRVEGPIELGPPAPRPIRGTAPSEAAVVGQYGSAGTLKIPGTVALVTVFFVTFVLYYFVNWKVPVGGMAASLEPGSAVRTKGRGAVPIHPRPRTRVWDARTKPWR